MNKKSDNEILSLCFEHPSFQESNILLIAIRCYRVAESELFPKIEALQTKYDKMVKMLEAEVVKCDKNQFYIIRLSDIQAIIEQSKGE